MSRGLQTVIGLEIHVQLDTKSKIFCGCSTDYIGAVPNSNVCPVCLGLPGSLPSLNEKVIRHAVAMALALGCSISEKTIFHRKNYFYPDLPKAYQISQYDRPLAVNGSIEIETCDGPRTIGITRLHLEEDAGKLIHAASDGRLAGADYSMVDYNRAGVPLAEIVSEPDMKTPAEAREYVVRLRQIARYLGISDGDMESGSLRVDANISLTGPDGSLGSKVEIKNMNSLRALEHALEFEIRRQREVLSGGGMVEQETRHWDDAAGVTLSSRSKEEAHDYRYFPEPDLPELHVSRNMIEDIRLSLPESPVERKTRFQSDFGVTEDDANVLTERREIAEWFEGLVKAGSDPKRASNWVRGDLLRFLKESGADVRDIRFSVDSIAELLGMVDSGKLSNTAARDVFNAMAEKGLSVEKAMAKTGISAGGVSGGALDALVDRILADNADVLEEIRSGGDTKGKKLKFLQGLVMRETRGQVDPAEAAGILRERAAVR